jgi:homospermidine synthase
MAEEIVSGNDDLGVLLYGHARGAMWYGSRLSIELTAVSRRTHCNGTAGHVGGAGVDGLGLGESTRGIRRGRRDGPRQMPADPKA